MNEQQEQEFHSNNFEDMSAISNMLTIADDCGLLTEVVWSFGKLQTVDIPAKCRYALNEWDC